MQCAPNAADFAEIMQNNYHCAIQGNSRSPILVPIDLLVINTNIPYHTILTLGGSVAEWLRHWTCNSQVASSIPGRDAVE